MWGIPPRLGLHSQDWAYTAPRQASPPRTALPGVGRCRAEGPCSLQCSPPPPRQPTYTSHSHTHTGNRSGASGTLAQHRPVSLFESCQQPRLVLLAPDFQVGMLAAQDFGHLGRGRQLAHRGGHAFLHPLQPAAGLEVAQTDGVQSTVPRRRQGQVPEQRQLCDASGGGARAVSCSPRDIPRTGRRPDTGAAPCPMTGCWTPRTQDRRRTASLGCSPAPRDAREPSTAAAQPPTHAPRQAQVSEPSQPRGQPAGAPRSGDLMSDVLRSLGDTVLAGAGGFHCRSAPRKRRVSGPSGVALMMQAEVLPLSMNSAISALRAGISNGETSSYTVSIQRHCGSWVESISLSTSSTSRRHVPLARQRNVGVPPAKLVSSKT